MWLQVEQQQQILIRRLEQAASAREALHQLKASPEPAQRIAQLILQQNQALYLARVLQVSSRCFQKQRPSAFRSVPQTGFDCDAMPSVGQQPLILVE